MQMPEFNPVLNVKPSHSGFVPPYGVRWIMSSMSGLEIPIRRVKSSFLLSLSLQSFVGFVPNHVFAAGNCAGRTAATRP